MLLPGPSEKIFDQSICRTKEQKARLQCLDRAIPKSEMPSGAVAILRGGGDWVGHGSQDFWLSAPGFFLISRSSSFGSHAQ